MKYQITGAGWRLSGVVCPAGTVLDFSKRDKWTVLAKGKAIPINATPLDAEAHEAQVRAYPDHRYLLSGGWEDK
jgi:hypothetical protein